MQEDSLHLVTAKLKEFSTVIIGFHKADGAWKKHNFSDKELVWIDSIAKGRKAILTVLPSRIR
ncbi:hypothetical protein LRS05_16195 [Flavobacterium sp. J372]|uniref:hypothetical protein n=1 Tax=Flavobacterium sp. J372 TaxID=2898436 RepID=UPI002150A8E0|nr:hypothetical protein [Flavobacterium sp. J372]MCR5863564.1 hypothetical protein [Flavobacterium sp. J372]